MLSIAETRSRIIELEKKKDFRQAHDLLREVLSMHPEDPFLRSNEVYLLFRLRKTKEARVKAEESVELLKNNAFFLRTYLAILEKLGAAQDIEELLERHLLSRRIGSEELYIFAARVAGRVFGKEKAAGLINRSKTLFPGSGALDDALCSIEGEGPGNGPAGDYHYYKEKFKGRGAGEAIAEIETIRLMPRYARDHDLLLYLAELYKKKGDLDRAVDLYRHVLTLRDNDFTRKMLGFAYYRKGDHDMALQYLRDFFIKNPDDHYLKVSINAIFKNRKDYEGLSKLVKEALAASPDSKHLMGMLAKAKKWRKDSATS